MAEPVVVTIDVNANPDVTFVYFKGTPTGWGNVDGYDDGTNGDATAGDNIWSATFDVECDGTAHEWGAVNQDDGWLLEGDNPAFTVNSDCGVEGQTSYTIPMTGGSVDLVLTVTDSNADIPSIAVKGAFGGWADIDMYDDGTNGDAMAGDGVWSVSVSADMPAAGDEPVSYEWGASRTDCSNGWLIQGPNVVFSVDDSGNVSGDTNYTIDPYGDLYDVTFRVFMGNEIFDPSDIYVTGEIETCSWSFNDVPLTQSAADPAVFEATLSLDAGTYAYKFGMGLGSDAGGENSPGTSFATVFQEGECGVDNGFGGSNRIIDLSGLQGNTVLDVVVFNTCEIYEIASVNETALTLDRFDISPNPALDQATINFTNDTAEDFTLSLRSITGQEVLSLNNLQSNSVTIATTEYPAGVYFATLTNAKGQSSTQRLVIR